MVTNIFSSVGVLPEDYPRSQFNKANKAEVQIPGLPVKGAKNIKGTEGPAGKKPKTVFNHKNESEVM